MLNALNLNWHRKYAGFENIDNYSADLVILGVFPDADKYGKAITKESVFENVYLISRVKNNGRIHLLKTIYGIINPSYYLKRAGIEEPLKLKEKYDYLVVPKFSNASAAIWQLNKKAKLQLYEDGLALYDGTTERSTLVSSNKTYKLLYKAFNYGRDFEEYEKVYLNKKSMYYNTKSEKAIQTPKFDNYYMNSVKEQLSCRKEMYNNKAIIWFGQPEDPENIEETRKALLNLKDKVVYKPHPRYGGDIKDFDIYENSAVWELDMLNIDDINSKCLVTFDSTSVFTPKMLYDFEPYIVLTFNIIKQKGDEDFKKLLNRFIDTYKDKNRIIIPDSVDELKRSIKRIAKTG